MWKYEFIGRLSEQLLMAPSVVVVPKSHEELIACGRTSEWYLMPGTWVHVTLWFPLHWSL